MANEEPGTSADPTDHTPPLWEKVAWLFDHIHGTDGKPLSDASVARAISDETGESISRQAIHNLRTGRATNPKWSTVRAIAHAFDVPVGYFSDDEESRRISEQLDLLIALRKTGIDRGALRALTELSSDGLQVVSEAIRSVVRREELQANKTKHSTKSEHQSHMSETGHAVESWNGE